MTQYQVILFVYKNRIILFDPSLIRLLKVNFKTQSLLFVYSL